MEEGTWVGLGERNVPKCPANSPSAGNTLLWLSCLGPFPRGLGGKGMRPGFTQGLGPGALSLLVLGGSTVNG